MPLAKPVLGRPHAEYALFPSPTVALAVVAYYHPPCIDARRFHGANDNAVAQRSSPKQ